MVMQQEAMIDTWETFYQTAKAFSSVLCPDMSGGSVIGDLCLVPAEGGTRVLFPGAESCSFSMGRGFFFGASRVFRQSRWEYKGQTCAKIVIRTIVASILLKRRNQVVVIAPRGW